MDKDRLDGSADRIAGSLKEAIGKVTGDTMLQAEGSAQKAGDVVQDIAGNAKDAVHDAVRT